MQLKQLQRIFSSGLTRNNAFRFFEELQADDSGKRFAKLVYVGVNGQKHEVRAIGGHLVTSKTNPDTRFMVYRSRLPSMPFIHLRFQDVASGNWINMSRQGNKFVAQKTDATFFTINSVFERQMKVGVDNEPLGSELRFVNGKEEYVEIVPFEA